MHDVRPNVMVNVVEDAVVVVARGQTASHVRPGAPSEPRDLPGPRYGVRSNTGCSVG